MNFILSIIISYFIGCIPFSLIISKIFADKDPGKMGSKNYGALNSYEITNNKIIGISVLLLDALKGALAVYITWNFFFPESIYILLSSIFVVVGHCFNCFLKFKGGRGLATALGSSLMFNPLIVVIWCIAWLLFRIVRKDVIFQNMCACIVAPIVVWIIMWFASGYLFCIFNYNYDVTLYEYKIYTIVLCAIIFIAHIRTNRFRLKYEDE